MSLFRPAWAKAAVQGKTIARARFTLVRNQTERLSKTDGIENTQMFALGPGQRVRFCVAARHSRLRKDDTTCGGGAGRGGAGRGGAGRGIQTRRAGTKLSLVTTNLEAVNDPVNLHATRVFILRFFFLCCIFACSTAFSRTATHHFQRNKSDLASSVPGPMVPNAIKLGRQKCQQSR